MTDIFGIDLGTTNCAMAQSRSRGPVRICEIAQLVAPGEIGRQTTLPSFLLRADEHAERLALPWNVSPDFVAGVLARDEGALVPARQVTSAKSWLANQRVDRTAPLLPWGSEGGAKLSPVQASSRLLKHLSEAWNHDHPGGTPLERHPIVLTVPASFDEEARELTAEAARGAGFDNFTLLEEPLAALYAWIAEHRRDLTSNLSDDTLILVCDVGGGTSDFSLIRARIDEGELAFERTAIGEHLLLGGDNLDLALAALAEQKLAGARLTLVQRQMLRRKCSAAKELLLSDPTAGDVPLTILGAGRGVVGGGLKTELTADDVQRALNEFLPITAADDLPARDRRVGLRELGLPYESEPAITKHLAAFLARAGGEEAGGMARPNAVLFNGGFFTPAGARERVLDALAHWFGERPSVLENARPEAAVAVGAAFYGRLKQDPAGSKRLLIQAGSARSHYIAVGDASDTAGGAAGAPSHVARGTSHVARGTSHVTSITALCVIPRGTQEGTRFALEREFTVVANRPAAFTLYSSRFRTDSVGSLVTFTIDDEITKHAPLVTALRYGKRSRSVPVSVRLSATFTETGTLELWCESIATGHRWRLAFNLRGTDLLSDEEPNADELDAPSVVIPDEALTRASALLRDVFGEAQSGPTPAALTGELENVLGHGKQAWPLGALRTLADVLLEHERGRAKSAAHEVRWLNLTGFCVRPGFGSASDPWRISELRKIYAAGLAFPRDVQNQVEWIVLWGRVGGGFTTGQQLELAQRIAGPLALGSRKPTRMNPQIERESWRLLASLERIDAGLRTRFGDELLGRIRREPRNGTWLWALGRLGARTPLYGPLNTVVLPAVAERWLEHLLSLKELTPDAALAIGQIGGRTGDPARDVREETADAAAERLDAAGFGEIAERLRTVIDADAGESARIFGEELPQGLMLVRL